MNEQAFREFTLLAFCNQIGAMASIEDIRRRNLRTLVSEMGSVAALAKAVGTSESQMSQWINGAAESKTGRPRGMRSASCRRIEKATNKTEGWLDKAHEANDTHPRSTVGAGMFLEAAYRAADESTQVLVSYLLSNNKQRPDWMSPALAAMIDSTKAMVAEHFPGERRGPTDYPTGTDPKIGSW